MGGQEGGQQFGQEVGHRRGVGEHPQMAAQTAAVGQQFVAQAIGLVQHQPGVVQKGLALRQQPHAARLLREQRQAALRFQRLDARARRGQRQVLPFGCPREVAQLGRSDEQPQVVHVEMHVAS